MNTITLSLGNPSLYHRPDESLALSSDPRVTSHASAARLRKGLSLSRGPAPPPSPSTERSAIARGVSSAAPAPVPASLFTRSVPRGVLAASLRVEPRALSLAPGAHLGTSSRFRGPQPWHLRAAPEAFETPDLTSNLVEGRRAASVSAAGTQSDALRARPPSPTFDRARCKTGVDAVTQIEHGTREAHAPGAAGPGTQILWNFDEQVGALVEELSEMVLEQAVLEERREVELRRIAARRGLLQRSVDADARAAAAMEAEARAGAARAAAAVAEARAAAERRTGALERVCAASMAASALRSIVERSFAQVRAMGGFVDPVQRAALDFIPRVYSDVADACDANARIAATLMGVAVQDALVAGVQRRDAAAGAAAEAAASAAAGGAAEAVRYSIRALVRLPRTAEAVAAEAHLPPSFVAEGDSAVHYVDEQDASGMHFRTVTVGPQRVLRADSVAAVEAGLATWLTEACSRHTRRVLALAGGAALGLCLRGVRLPPDSCLLDLSPDDLGALLLHPVRGDVLVPWLHDIPEELLPQWGAPPTEVVAPSSRPLHEFVPVSALPRTSSRPGSSYGAGPTPPPDAGAAAPPPGMRSRRASFAMPAGDSGASAPHAHSQRSSAAPSRASAEAGGDEGALATAHTRSRRASVAGPPQRAVGSSESSDSRGSHGGSAELPPPRSRSSSRA